MKDASLPSISGRPAQISTVAGLSDDSLLPELPPPPDSPAPNTSGQQIQFLLPDQSTNTNTHASKTPTTTGTSGITAQQALVIIESVATDMSSAQQQQQQQSSQTTVVAGTSPGTVEYPNVQLTGSDPSSFSSSSSSAEPPPPPTPGVFLAGVSASSSGSGLGVS